MGIHDQKHSQVLDDFQKFHVAVERETGLSLKVTNSNKEGENRGSFKSTAESM